MTQHEDDLSYAELDLAVPEAPEQRSAPRLRNPGIGGRLPQRLGVRLVDISVSGAGLETLVPLGTELDYRLVFESDGRQLERDASLIWNRLERTAQSGPGEVAPIYRSGFAFQPGEPGQARDLMVFIRELGPEPKRNLPNVRVDDSLERAATRYSLTKGFRLFLDAEPECTIETLSVSGLLFESRVRCEPGAAVHLFLGLPRSEIEVTGRVISVSRSARDPIPTYRIALEFVEISDSGRSDLNDYLSQRFEAAAARRLAGGASSTSVTPPEGVPRLIPSPAVGDPLALPSSQPAAEASGSFPAGSPAPAGWILPTLASLLGLGVLLTSVSGDAIREISHSAWAGQYATTLAWGLKAVGAGLVGLAGYLGLRWVLHTRRPRV